MLNIGVLVSGGGTNLQKLIDAQAAGQIVNGQLRVVIASRPDAYALERAKKAGIEAITLRRKDYGSVEEYSQALIDALQERGVDRVVLDAMLSQGLTVGLDPVPEIPVTEFLAPRGIDLTHRNYILMDGRYYTVLYIRGNGYPSRVRAGWMSALINAGEGIDIDIHLRRENRSRAIDRWPSASASTAPSSRGCRTPAPTMRS